MNQDPTGAFRPNGLSTPVVIGTNGDNIANIIYAGDVFGNLWKFYWDTASNQWKIATFGNTDPTPIFTAKDANGVNQPITSRPNVKKRGADLQIYFGTGKYFEVDDKDITNATPQTFYAILDNQILSNSSGIIPNRSTLLQQQILAEPIVTTAGTTETLRVTTATQPTAAQRGWYLDLVSPVAPSLEGERIVTGSLLRDDRIIFTTLIPSSDPCAYGGSGWLMELDAKSGSRLNYPPFDLNKDKKFTDADMIVYLGVNVVASGKLSKVGIIPMPAIMDAGSVEYKYNPGTSGNIGITVENPGLSAFGRQSWHEIR